jgi:hypothetical protein
MHGMKKQKKDCLKGPLWFLCNQLAKPTKGRLGNQWSLFSILQKAIYSVGGIPFPAFVNFQKGRNSSAFGIGAGTPHTTTAAKEYIITEAFFASTEDMLQTLYMQFMCLTLEDGR